MTWPEYHQPTTVPLGHRSQRPSCTEEKQGRRLTTEARQNIATYKASQKCPLDFPPWLKATWIWRSQFLASSNSRLLNACIISHLTLVALLHYLIIRQQPSRRVVFSLKSVTLKHLYTANRKSAGSTQRRHRGHSFALPTIHLEFNKGHFVARVLFDYVWCVSHVCFNKITLGLFLIHF